MLLPPARLVSRVVLYVQGGGALEYPYKQVSSPSMGVARIFNYFRLYFLEAHEQQRVRRQQWIYKDDRTECDSRISRTD